MIIPGHEWTSDGAVTHPEALYRFRQILVIKEGSIVHYINHMNSEVIKVRIDTKKKVYVSDMFFVCTDDYIGWIYRVQQDAWKTEKNVGGIKLVDDFDIHGPHNTYDVRENNLQTEPLYYVGKHVIMHNLSVSPVHILKDGQWVEYRSESIEEGVVITSRFYVQRGDGSITWQYEVEAEPSLYKAIETPRDKFQVYENQLKNHTH